MITVRSDRLPDRPMGSGLWGYGSDRIGYPIGLWGQGYGLGVGSDRLPDRPMGSGLWVRGRIGSATR